MKWVQVSFDWANVLKGSPEGAAVNIVVTAEAKVTTRLFLANMGIPKFFRWLSERYPLSSQLLSGSNVPEFDNFYLDMNGIIHNCARPIADSGKPFTELDMYKAIFSYVEDLFEKIKPKEVFFLAVDGVAPRAKMNQQRARRFRSAKEAEQELTKAKKKNGTSESLSNLPPENTERFDSNCITPGTSFMSNLDAHMKYFISMKMAEGASWSDVKVIYSGSDVPGEGEHKIMEYIRLNKAKPGYNPNVRHCMYGLDADLILLGLLSHDPHFALLREEVTFGRPGRAPKSVSETRFYLLHICILREYLSREFSDILTQHKLSLERIIDDFILILCFVGNDFLPNLPNIHLGDGILNDLLRIYQDYISEHQDYLLNNGLVNFTGLSKFLESLSILERKTIALAYPSYFDENGNPIVETSSNPAPQLNDELGLQNLHASVSSFINRKSDFRWVSPKGLNKKQIKFLHDAAFIFHLLFELDASGVQVYLEKDPNMYQLPYYELASKQFAGILAEIKSGNSVVKTSMGILSKWKDDYYTEKLLFNGLSFRDDVNTLLKSYCDGLQWNMYYYYEGVASWSWYYPYHYAPHISDLSAFMKDYCCQSFDMGSPLMPLEQLMAVLPPLSVKLVPKALSWLMTSTDSRIKDFYPEEFETDLNGKKNRWEAIVLVPFIDERRLVVEIKKLYDRIEPEARYRNKFGQTLQIRAGILLIPSFVKAPSQDLESFTTQRVEIAEYKLPVLELSEKFIATLCHGALTGIHAMPGFPTLENVPSFSFLDSGVGLHVFGQVAKGSSIVISLENTFSTSDVQKLLDLLGKIVYVDWPYLREALVVEIWTSKSKFEIKDNKATISPLDTEQQHIFNEKADKIEKEYRKYRAVIIRDVEILVWVSALHVIKMTPELEITKVYEDQTEAHAMQTVVICQINKNGQDRRNELCNSKVFSDAQSVFPVNSTCIYMRQPATCGVVLGFDKSNNQLANVKLEESDFPWCPNVSQVKNLTSLEGYALSGTIAREVGISNFLLSKLASSLCLFFNGQLVRGADIGLNLKSEKRGICALGYAIKLGGKWYFSNAVKTILEEYKRAFPGIFIRMESCISDPSIDGRKIFDDIVTKEDLIHRVNEVKNVLIDRLGKFEFIGLNHSIIRKDKVDQLFELWDKTERNKVVFTTRTVPVSQLLSYKNALTRLESLPQEFNIGDAAIFVGSSAVPFGSRFIVIGHDENKLVCLSHLPCKGCSDLGGFVPSCKGVILPRSECLKVIFNEKPLSRGQDLGKIADRAGLKTNDFNRTKEASLVAKKLPIEELFAAAAINKGLNDHREEKEVNHKHLLKPNLSWGTK